MWDKWSRDLMGNRPHVDGTIKGNVEMAVDEDTFVRISPNLQVEEIGFATRLV